MARATHRRQRWSEPATLPVVPAPRHSRRKQDQEEPAWDAPRWPQLSATWAGVDPAELTERHARAQLLLAGGWEALEGWLLAEPTAEERQAQSAFQIEG